MRITTVLNGKGGVGKTTTTSILGQGLDKSKYKPLVIDYEPSGNLSHYYGIDITSCATMYHVFTDQVSTQDIIQQSPFGDIIPGNNSLHKVSSLFRDREYIPGTRRLRNELEKLKEDYTHIFIDCQPSVGGMLTTQALISCDDLVVPCQATDFSLQGLPLVSQGLEEVRAELNPDIKVCGVLLIEYSDYTTIEKSYKKVIEEWARSENTQLFLREAEKKGVRPSVVVKEAQATKKSLFDYAPNSNPAQDFRIFINEYLDRE